MPTGAEVFEQLSWHWDAQLRPRLERIDRGRAALGPGAGLLGRAGRPAGLAVALARSAPLTTIAWRLAHIGFCFHHRWQAHFGPREFDTAVPADLVAFVDEGYRLWSTSVLAADEERMNRPHQGPPGSADEYYPFWAVVLHINREVIHHGAEVALLRDLYLRQAPQA
jgi:hypothetical protein